MEYHSEWESPSPEHMIKAHVAQMEKLLNRADLEIGSLRYEVASYMNANEMIWGWKLPTTDRDKIDLIFAVAMRYPNFRFEVNHDVNHMLEVLRAPIGKANLERAETMEDHYQPRKYVDKIGAALVDLVEAVGDAVSIESKSYSSYSHTSSHDSGSSCDSGSGGGGCD